MRLQRDAAKRRAPEACRSVNMKTPLSILAAIIVMCGSACTTSMLWDSTDPQEYVEILDASVSIQELNDRGIKYRVDQATNRVFVAKSSLRKLGDYTIRTLATPLTIVIDTASTLVVVAVLSTKHDWDQEVKHNPDDPKPILLYPNDELNSPYQ